MKRKGRFLPIIALPICNPHWDDDGGNAVIGALYALAWRERNG